MSCLGVRISNLVIKGARNHGLLNVTATDFFNLRIPLPPLEEISRIVKEISFLEEKIVSVKNSVDSSKILQKSLINQIF